MSEPKPFKVDWSETEVRRVLDQVRAYPWPPAPAVDDGWLYGCDATFLEETCAHWADKYDWRAAVAELNRFPQFTARIEDFDIHFVHVVGEAGGKRPLILTHGWPGSHYEFWGSIEKLAFPSRFGGDPADAFDVVVPSLPGFGFSSKPAKPVGQRLTARLFDALMTQVLSYDSYLAQGGDWGGLVTSWLGHNHGPGKGGARAIHLNMIGFRPSGSPQSPEEIAWITRTQAAGARFGAYLPLQVSKPQSLAWLGAGNPVGQAAWILERFYDWSDLRTKPLIGAYTRDQLLTNVMIYVMTGSFTTGAWYYRGLMEEGGVVLPEGVRCETPTAFANFPGEALYQAPPRSWADRAYNITRWTEMRTGGHFAAMEEPDAFVADVRAWAASL